jgi:hypothetical protein
LPFRPRSTTIDLASRSSLLPRAAPLLPHPAVIAEAIGSEEASIDKDLARKARAASRMGRRWGSTGGSGRRGLPEKEGEEEAQATRRASRRRASRRWRSSVARATFIGSLMRGGRRALMGPGRALSLLGEEGAHPRWPVARGRRAVRGRVSTDVEESKQEGSLRP